MTEKLRVLVADDESVARKRLVRLLEAMDDVTVAGECASGDAVLARVREANDVDVVLLDIRMPGLTGLDAASLLPGDRPIVVLCTAHPDHAVEAFERGAADYVLKPIEAARLRRAITRARERLEPRASGPAIPRLAIETRSGIVLLDPKQVSHAVLDGELVTVVAESGAHLSDGSLADLEERLPRPPFERVHRRALLNLEHVVRLEPQETGGFLARMRSGHAVEVSRQAARELRRRLGIR